MREVNGVGLGWVRRLSGLGLALGVAGAALLGLHALAEAAARAVPLARPADFTVASTIDAPDDNPGDGQCQDTEAPQHPCSLRAAVQEMDAGTTGGDIVLGFATYVLTDEVDGDLQLKQDINIYGIDPGLSTIQGGPGWTHRILRVQNGAHVVMDNLVISGGNVPAANGGGLDIQSGSVSLFATVIENNQAARGGGIYNSGQLDIIDSTLSNNHAITDGGGLYNDVSASPNLTADHVSLTSNTAAGLGGGAYNTGVMSLNQSSVSQNNAGGGGGLENSIGGLMTITGSVLSTNIANNGYGAGVENGSSSATLALVNTTVSGNQDTGNGGGVAAFAGTVDLSSVTIADNTATGAAGGGGLYAGSLATVILRNTIIARNVASGSTAADCAGTLDSKNYNLVQNITGCNLTDQTSHNVPPQDPKLFPLGNYGGPTLAQALAVDSPAIDAGNVAGCKNGQGQVLITDQRGFTRSFDGDANGTARCDIGAFELSWVARLLLPLLRR